MKFENEKENLLKCPGPFKFIEIAVEVARCRISKEQLPNLLMFYGKLPQKDLKMNKYGVGLCLIVEQSLAKMMGPSDQDFSGGIYLTRFIIENRGI